MAEQAVDVAEVDRAVDAFLGRCKTASLATVGGDGLPYAANIQYVHDHASRLYWVSKPTADHSVHLAAQPWVAVTIYAHVDTPAQIHGLQMRGQAHAIGPADAGQACDALTLYRAKYPFVADPPYAQALASQYFYVFTPSWLRWIDTRRGFGWKHEWVPGPGV